MFGAFLLDPTDAETYQRGGRFSKGVLQGHLRGLLAVLAGDVEDVGHLDPVLAERTAGGHVQRLGDGPHGQADHVVRVRGDLQLGVPDPLRDEVAGQAEDEGGHVLRLAYQGVDGPVDLGEVGEVGEGVEAAQLLLRGGHLDAGMAARQLQHGGHRGRAHQVHVQFDLGQGVDEGVKGHADDHRCGVSRKYRLRR